MKISVTGLCLWTFVAAMCLLLPSRGPAKKKGAKRAAQVAALVKNLEGVDLSDEQATKIKELAATHSDKITAARKKLGKSGDRMGDLRLKAAQQGKKRKDLQTAGF